MRNKLVLALAAVVLMGVPAFAAIQNVKVSGDIDSTYLNRQHFGLGQTTTVGANTRGIQNIQLVNQSVFLTQTRLRIDADLSDNVSTTVGLINERAWAAEGKTTGSTQAQNTDVQVYLAYATLREFLYSPLTVTVGRQIFNYGNGLIMGDGGQNNLATGDLAVVAADLTKRTSYDGIKAVLDYKPLTLDLIYFKNAATDVTGSASAHQTNSNVYGINTNYQLGDAMNTVAEAYFFARVNGNHNTATTTDKGDTLYVPGLRVSTNPIKGLNTQAEVAWQSGRKSLAPGGSTTSGGDNLHRQAMAAQFMASYALPVAQIQKYKPVTSFSYTYVSGDKRSGNARPVSGNTSPPSSGERYNAWDPFNESQGSGTIYNSLFDLTNMNIVSASLQANPIQDVTTQFVWSGLWASKKISAQNPLTFRQPDGSTNATATFAGATTSNLSMGNEYDLNVSYAYTEDVTLGVSLGWYVPGKLFANLNNSTASQALAHVLVNF